MDATLGPSFFVRNSAIPKPTLFNLVATRRARSRLRLEWWIKIRGFGHCSCGTERGGTSSSLEGDTIVTLSLALLWQIRFVLLDRRSGPKGTSSTAVRVEERDHGRAYGWKARLRRWTARLFSPDWPLEGAGAGGRGRRPCS